MTWITRGGVVAWLALAGCNATGLTSNNDGATANDGAATGDGGADLRASNPDLAGFCGNPSSPRIEVNGMLAASPAVTATLNALNCCDSAQLEVISMQIPQPIALVWRHNVGQPPNTPTTIDLANVPSSWTVTVYSGCSPTQPGCTPTDTYTTDLAGSLTVSGNGASYQMSTCMTATESAANPHPVLHSLRLWVPTITTQ